MEQPFRRAIDAKRRTRGRSLETKLEDTRRKRLLAALRSISGQTLQ
jgi:hypothetical protein